MVKLETKINNLKRKASYKLRQQQIECFGRAYMYLIYADILTYYIIAALPSKDEIHKSINFNLIEGGDGL